MESAKLMVEAKLQETGQQLMECERQLITATARRAAGGTLIDVQSLTISSGPYFSCSAARPGLWCRVALDGSTLTVSAVHLLQRGQRT